MASGRVSIPASLIDPKCTLAKLAADGVCSVCLNLAREPRETNCEHVFCRPCISRCSHCPNCRTYVTELKHPNRTLRGVLETVTVKCKHREEGCKERVAAKDMEKHLQNDCLMEETVCRFQGCGVQMKRGKLASHERNCLHRTLPCERCNLPIAFNGKRQHNMVCPKMPVKCPKKCNAEILRSRVQEHLDTQCPEETVKCFVPGCDVELKRKLMGAHQERRVEEHRRLFARYQQEPEVLNVCVELPDFERKAFSAEDGSEFNSSSFVFQGSRFFLRVCPKEEDSDEGGAWVSLCKKGHFRGKLSWSLTIDNYEEGETESVTHDFSKSEVNDGPGHWFDLEELVSAALETKDRVLKIHLRIASVHSGTRFVHVNGYGPAVNGGGAGLGVGAARPY